jgi:tetrahedral aminopeptidase
MVKLEELWLDSGAASKDEATGAVRIGDPVTLQQGEILLGTGPVIFRGPNMNPAVTRRLIEIAERERIPFQVAAIGIATPNDANRLPITRGGVATGLVAVPNRCMHSAVETVSLDDLDRAADLLAPFARSLRWEDDFTP